jgi:uncharacterized protein (TIGR03086 family)
MSDIADRYSKVAAGFTERVRAVPDGAWERPAPCEGWVARDVVRHLTEWVPGFFDGAGGPPLPTNPSADDDPVGAWTALDAALQALLDDPVASAATMSHPRAGTHRVDDVVGTFVLGDVLVHTWDLARATGLDERLDPDEVHGMLVGLEAMEEVLRSSGQYGQRVEVPADADEQTRLIAFCGRQP